MTGVCPKCEKPITRLVMTSVKASVPLGTVWNSVTYNCPSCKTVISASIDPVAIKTDIVNELTKKLKKP